MRSSLLHRAWQLHYALIAISLVAALSACARQDKNPDAQPAQDPIPAVVADPMASFARLVGGEWRVTFASGTSAFDSWTLGPGKHSMRGGALEVIYWHPGRKQVCLLSLHPDIPGVGRGSGEGTFRFEGEIADGVLDLHQPRGPRRLATRWSFDGPDKYHDELLEDTGTGFKPLAEWDRFRVPKRSGTRPSAAEDAPTLPEHLKAFEALLGRTWEAKGDGTDGTSEKTFDVQSTFEFVPDYVYARVLTPSKDAEPTHLLDAYFYQHVGTGALRCLALSNRGDVYEGEVTVVDGGALQLDVKGFEGDRVVPFLVRLDFEKDATVRQRVWSLDGADRTLMLDAHHWVLEPRNR